MCFSRRADFPLKYPVRCPVLLPGDGQHGRAVGGPFICYGIRPIRSGFDHRVFVEVPLGGFFWYFWGVFFLLFFFPLAASELRRAPAAWPCPASLEPPRGRLLSSPASRGRAGAELGLLSPYQQDSSSVLVQLLLFLRIPSSVCVLCLSRGTVNTESGAVPPAASPVPEQEKLRAAAFWGGGVVSLQGSCVGKAWPVREWCGENPAVAQSARI